MSNTNVISSGLIINTHSIMNKVSDLRALTDVYSPAFVFLTEMWLKPHVPDSFFIDCSRYSVISHDRADGASGGVCATVNSKFTHTHTHTHDRFTALCPGLPG